MPKRTLDQQHSIIEAAHEYNVILDSREIFIKDSIDSDGETGISFVKNLSLLSAKDQKAPIIIHQYNIGGDWSCGMIIFDAIVACSCPIIFLTHGIASSMGAVIPLACIKHDDAYIVTMPHCEWMIHSGTTGITSEHTLKQSKSLGRWEIKQDKLCIDYLVEAGKRGNKNAGKTEKQIRSYVQRQLDTKEDWYLSAREAVDFGLADAVLGDKNFETLENIKSHW